MHPLDGPRLKIERAEYHLQYLNEILRSWENTEPAIITGHPYPDQSAYVYIIEIKAVELWWGVVVGDIFHNLHSALDNIVWQLALKKRATPFDRTAFPIYLTNTSKARADICRLLQDVPDDARTLIEGLQPYTAANPSHHPLWILHEFSDCDKHRIITLSGQRLRYDMRAGMTLHSINNYTDEITVPMADKDFPPPPPKIHCDCLIITDKGGTQWKVDVVEAIYKCIRDEVFPRFMSFFP